MRSAGALAPSEERGRRRELLKGVREVVGEEEDVLGGVGRAGVRVRARALAWRSAGRWGRRGRAHLSSGGERQAIAEAASPM